MIKYNSSEIIECYLGNNMLDSIYKGSNLIWSAGPHDYSRDYFTIESLANNNTISVKNYFGSTMAGPENGLTLTLYWSTDKVNWTSVTISRSSSQAGPSIISSTITTLNNGEKIYIKGNTPTGGQAHPDGRTSNANYYNYFSSTANINVQGNIMSLLYGDNFENQTTLTNTYCFQYLFYKNTYIVDASNLVLPATTLTNYCYQYMFSGCTSLTTAPELPATTLTTYCYNYMFQGCTSLTTAPELPATTLADNCYYNMFFGCTSLTTAPELPATTLVSYCYSYMFYGCTSLTTAPELPATTLANSCYGYMLYNTNVLPDCTNIDFTSSTIVSSGGLRALFAGTKVTDNDLMNILPKNSSNKYCLPVTTLADNCYYNMFSGCTSLTTAPELPATTLVSKCYYYMFYGCTSLTTAPELPATTLASYCYGYMFRGCTSLTTAPELPATTLADNCYYNMFFGCTSLTTAPELPATTLVSYCYSYMFYGCTSLNYIKALFTTTPSTTYTGSWVYNVAASGTFIKSDSATWNITGTYGVPSGWTLKSEGDPADNASMKLYDNYQTGTGSNRITISTGTSTYGSNTSVWYYNSKHLSINSSNITTSKVFYLNMVIIGFSQFKVFISASSTSMSGISLNKIDDDTSVAYSDITTYSSNSHIQVAVNGSSTKEYTYTNLDPNTKYNIRIHFRCNGNGASGSIRIPTSYPDFTTEHAHFTSSSDYTEIYTSS